MAYPLFPIAISCQAGILQLHQALSQLATAYGRYNRMVVIFGIAYTCMTLVMTCRCQRGTEA